MAVVKLNFEEALKVLCNNLKVSPDALTYLKTRCVSKRQVESFKIGYTGDLTVEITDRVFRDKPVLLKPKTLVFPLIDLYDYIRGFNTRNLSPDGSGGAYSKVNWGDIGDFIYGLHNNLEKVYNTKTVLLCEGQFDFLSVEPYFPASGSVLTSMPSKAMLEVILRYADRIIFLHDGDKAGLRAKEYMETYVSKKITVNSIIPRFKDLNKWRVSDPENFKEYFQELAEDFLD